jgi:lipopolysaccharide transport system ATP-binding protein
MTAIISIENLHKKYTLKHNANKRYSSLRDELANVAQKIVGRLKNSKEYFLQEPSEEEFWALNGINLEIQQGERLGIIGRNGAGKSTLLKVISRIIEPTKGRVTLRGRVSSLLEVGTGFHPELSGRENIYLNGAILGMSKAEIASKFDEIVEFAEVERFLDTPVKHYSSGMYVRLAFAVASSLEPEVLVIDEVLAVGDAKFQKKCLGKMEDVSKSGRTIIFVSHGMSTISSVCTRAVLLNQGHVEFDGNVSEAVMRYYTMDSAVIGIDVETENVKFLQAFIQNQKSKAEITIHEEIVIVMRYRIKKKLQAHIVPNFHFYKQDGVCAFVSSAANITYLDEGEYEARCKIPANFLNEGFYSIDLAITTYFEDGTYKVEFLNANALLLNVVDYLDKSIGRYGYLGPMPGVLRPQLEWDVNQITG